ncbi:pyrroline-5-carboxylate reductase dimerization domain-containing protein [uncultured Roseibium sp.]|uniref:pyrroline-5-carboxylate reductase family protein n=1 Tax=uncultured Roseibium sp. TaxID=1936171 RepID=UPI00263454A6|nr:pyrroline-5-carboxylate reductase dimerization domain-containing protein [uncultured Roseibium sp.]
MPLELTLGIIGGSGQLGSAVAAGWLTGDCIRQENLWVSNRSGRSSGLDDWTEVQFTASNQVLADACDVVVLSVPPALIDTIDIQVPPEKLVLSLMAGVSRQQIRDLTGTRKAVRAMSSPAARQRLAYSPWFAPDGLDKAEKKTVQTLLSAIGETDEVLDERHIEVFTVLTGPVPGFAAFFADCLVQYALANGVAPEAAVKSVKQLFLSSGGLMSEAALPPASFVAEMIDYGGTTASGLKKLQELEIARTIAEGLNASLERVQTIAPTD